MNRTADRVRILVVVDLLLPRAIAIAEEAEIHLVVAACAFFYHSEGKVERKG